MGWNKWDRWVRQGRWGKAAGTWIEDNALLYDTFTTDDGTDGSGTLVPPLGFGWTPPINVYKSGSTFTTDLDMSDYEVTGSGVYYVATDGDDSDPGTLAEPLRRVSTAIDKADADVIWVKPGFYDYGFGWDGEKNDRPQSLRKYGSGDVIISTTAPFADLTWVAEAAPNDDVYKAAYATAVPLRVWDASIVDANGDYERLTTQASVAAVQASAGSYYITGNDVYVRTSDSRVPDSDVRVFINVLGSGPGFAQNFYGEGIEFHGSFGGSETGTHTWALKDCVLKYSTNDGYSMKGGSLFILENCLAAQCTNDGFKVDDRAGVVPNMVLVDCIGRDGYGSDVSNGVSAHAGAMAHVLTVNCTFSDNAGPNHGDTEDCRTWCVAETCESAGTHNFNIIDGLMWCDSCVSITPGDTGYVAGVDDTLYVRNCTGTASQSGAVEDGTITSPRTCEPGPGTLTIVDTGNNADIVDGALKLTGRVARSDPGAYGGWTQAARVAGIAGFGEMRCSSGDAIFLELDDSWDDSPNSCYMAFAANGVVLRENNVDVALTGVYVYNQVFKAINITRSVGLFFVLDGKLLWVTDASTQNLDLVAVAVDSAASDTRCSVLAAAALADYNAAWGGDWTEVTDSESSPASGTTFDCEADCHIKSTFTYEEDKYLNVRARATGGSYYTDAFYILANGALHIRDTDQSGNQTVVAAGIGLFSDGVEYTIDTVFSGASVKLYLDGVLTLSGIMTKTDNLLVSGGLFYSDQASIDIAITTHPYPALGIATSRVVAPQDNDTFDHEADCVVELKNVTLSSSLSPNIRFRYTSDTNSIPLAIGSDGSIILYNNASAWNALITGGAGTVSDGDDIVLVLDGVNAEVFVAGTSVGTTSSLAIVGVSGGVCSELVNGITFDHIACFPRDVSGLLPKGTF